MRSAREAAMSGNHIPESVYDNLVETINKNRSFTSQICRTS